MDPTQFDDFIKSNTQNELPVPPELSWEHMNFNLPPGKKKRRIFPWFIFLFFSAAGIATVWWWYTYPLESSPTQPSSNMDSPKAQNQHIPKILDGTNIALSPESLQHEQNKIPADQDVPYQNPEETEPFNRREVFQGGRSLSTGQAAESTAAESELADAPMTNPSELVTPSKGIDKSAPESLNPCPPLSVLSMGSIHSTTAENLLTIPIHEHSDSNTSEATRSRYFLVSAGSNKARMNHSIADMNDAETAAWGNSYQLVFDQELKNNWLLSVGLGYHRLHSTFYFEKDLGTYVNLAQGQVIRQTRRVFHNNYFHMASLLVGGGKQFILSPRWKGQVFVYVSPSYQVEYTGRVLVDSENIIDLAPGTVAKNRWFLNSDAALRLSYNLNKTDLILGINLTQSLTKSTVLSNPDYQTRVQPQILGLHLGVKRTL